MHNSIAQSRQLSTSHLMFNPNDPLTRECPTKGNRYRTSIAPAGMPYITRGVTTQKNDYRKGIPDGFDFIIGPLKHLKQYK
jgi:hypothetical protein